MSEASYEVCATPVRTHRDEVEVLIYRGVPAGISGPFSEPTVVPLLEIGPFLPRNGYTFTGEPFEWASNGFWHAPIERVAS